MTLTEYRDRLRQYIKDIGELNRLLEFDVENDDAQLDLYIQMASEFLNVIPPLIGGIALESFPMPTLIIHQATIECLISNSIVQARNDLTYNNGGVTVKVDDANRYLNILQNLYRQADREIESYIKWKIAVNIDGGYGGVSSPYLYAHAHGRGFHRLI